MHDHPVVSTDILLLAEGLRLRLKPNVCPELVAKAINRQLSGYFFDLEQDKARFTIYEKQQWLKRFRGWLSAGAALLASEGPKRDLPELILKAGLDSKGVDSDFGAAAAALDEAAGGIDNPAYDSVQTRWHEHTAQDWFDDEGKELLDWTLLAEAQLSDVLNNTRASLAAFQELVSDPELMAEPRQRGRPKDVHLTSLIACLGEIYCRAHAPQPRFVVSTRSEDNGRYGPALDWCREIFRLAAHRAPAEERAGGLRELDEWASGPHALAEVIKDISKNSVIQSSDGIRSANGQRWSSLDPKEISRWRRRTGA